MGATYHRASLPASLTGERQKARALLARLAEAGRRPDWALGLSREVYRDPATRERLADGLRRALSFLSGGLRDLRRARPSLECSGTSRQRPA